MSPAESSIFIGWVRRTHREVFDQWHKEYWRCGAEPSFMWAWVGQKFPDLPGAVALYAEWRLTVRLTPNIVGEL